MTRNNTLILATLYEVRGQDKGTASRKADRTALPQVAVAYQAGHEVNMQSIMQHKFTLVRDPTGWVWDIFPVTNCDRCNLSSEYLHKEQLCLATTFATAEVDKPFDKAFEVNCLGRKNTS